MRPRPLTLWSIAAFMFLGIIALRWFAADQLMYGPRDVDVFADRPYGVQVDREAHPFFLMWTRSDGQAFFSIAGDLDGDEQAAGLGNLSYRMSRIGMSVLARLLTFGNDDWLLYTLPIVSLLAFLALVLVAMRLVDRLGPRALLLPLTPAAIIGTIYDSAEPLGTVLLVASLTATTLVGASLAAVALGVSRPSYAIGVPASRLGLQPAILAVGAGASLQLLIVLGFGIPFSGGAGNLALPITGLIEEWPRMAPSGQIVAAVVLGSALALVTFAASGRYVFSYRATCALTAVFSLCLGAAVYQETFSPFRATAPAFVLIILAPLFRADSGTEDVSVTVPGPASE